MNNAVIPYIIGILLSGVLVFLIYAAHFFYTQAYLLLELQVRYRYALYQLQQALSAMHNDDGESNDVLCDDQQKNPLVINRTTSYLKESTEHFFKTNELHHLLDQLDQQHWQEYAGYTLPNIPDQKTQKKRTIVHHPARRWQKRRQVIAQKETVPFCWPIEQSQFWVSSFFGPRRKRDGSLGFHYGVDMAAVKGTVVKSAAHGVVIEAGYAGGYGNTVVVQHDQTFKTRYAHLDTVSVTKNQKIYTGQKIGTVGETGHIRKKSRDGSHLHFEIHKQNKRMNPLRFLPTL